jgi:hypothetical protein
MAVTQKSFVDDSSSVKAARKKLDKAKAALADAKKAKAGLPANAGKDLASQIDTRIANAQKELDAQALAVKEVETKAKDYFTKNEQAIQEKAAAKQKATSESNVASVEEQIARMKAAGLDTTQIEASLAKSKEKKTAETKTDKTAETVQEQKPEDFAGLLKTAPEFIRKMSSPDRKILAAKLNEAFGTQIPVVGVYTDALLGAYQNAISGALASYSRFKDIFTVEQYIQEKKAETAAIKAAGGAGGPSLAQYPIISSRTDAKALFNKVFQSELGRDATADEIKKLFPALQSAQAANPESTKTTKINGKTVLERTSGLNTEQWVIDQLGKDERLKAELDKRNLQSPDLNKRLADKKIYDDAMAKAGDDPAKIQAIKDTTTYGRGIKEFENGIAQIAMEQGATNTPEEITAIAKALYDKGIPATGSTFKQEVNTALKFGADKIGKYTGKAGETFADLATTAAANGIDLQKTFGTQIPNWISAVEKGESVDTFKRLIRETAKIGMPEKVAKLIDQGVDLETIYTPYKNLMATTLEINPKTIGLNDPTLRSAITADAEVPLYEFERQLRKDNRWQYTNQAKSEVGDATQRILKDFGFMG